MKHFILSCFLIATVVTGYSQYNVRLSFVGDPSVNWMRTSNSNTKNGKSILGYDYGINGDFYFSEDERYSFSTGIQITNTGGQISYHSNSPFGFSGKTLPALSTIKYRIRYIEIPLNIKLRTDQFNGVKYWGLLGFSTMVNIASKGTSNDGMLNKDKINDEVNLFNLAMNIGLGFDYELNGSNSFTTGIIFQNGLMDVTTDNAFSDKTNINSLKLKIGLIF